MVAGSTFGFGRLFPLLSRLFLGAIFLVGVGAVVVILLLLGLVEVILVSLVNMSVWLWRNA
jgi:hypothetical protein